MIIIQNIYDNECFKWCLVKHLYPADHNPRRIAKVNKDFDKEPGSKDIKFPVKIRNIHKIKRKKKSIAISVFGYESKEIYPICVSKKCCVKKHVHLSLKGEEDKRHHVLKILIHSCITIYYIMKENNFFRYCLRTFVIEEILKRHIKKCFKVNVKQRIKMPKKKG